MRLADFIVSEQEAILAAWVEFARTSIAVGRVMTDLALRDDAGSILRAVAEDMRTAQTREEQQSKSHGKVETTGDAAESAAHAHGLQRSRSGFEVNQMVSEFRALRATVLRLWAASSHQVSVRDLEDVTRFNEAIDEALADSLKKFVGEVDRARSLFLGVLGHDLRTPLSTVVACATVLHHRHPEDSREYGLILRSAERMRDLVDVVFAYTRSSLGSAMRLELAPVDLIEVSRHCIRELSIANPGREVSLSFTGDTKGEWDSGRLAQLISNLVGNALKYGAQDKPVTVTLNGDDPLEVTLQVHNFGPPIQPDRIHDIFEPLVRGGTPAGPARSVGADLGLGLYIARDVASAHCGSISAASAEGTGTSFDVRLPRSAKVLSADTEPAVTVQ